ncbi:hypothetical protein Tco_1317076 [Tanacetum coccineum]
MPSQQRKRHLKGSHWSSQDKNDTIEAKKHTLKWDFTLNLVQKKHKYSDTRNVTLAIRVLQKINPTVIRWDPMIGKDSRDKIKLGGACKSA